MTRKINKTRYAILGMLLDKPKSGYEIKKIMSCSTNYFWKESDASIYPMLKILAREEKVVAESLAVNRRRKEVFSITNSGRQEFEIWMKKATEPDTLRSEFLLKLFFTLDKKRMEELFAEMLPKLEERMKIYGTIKERLEGLDFPGKEFRMRTLENGMAHTELEIQFLKGGLC